MADASLVFGSDLLLGPTGDLASVSGDAQTQQRVIRRLCTNPGGYIWALSYGGGFPAFVGATVTADQIGAVARAQMALEATVAQSPAPVVTTSADSFGNITASITYATSNGAQTVAVPLS